MKRNNYLVGAMLVSALLSGCGGADEAAAGKAMAEAPPSSPLGNNAAQGFYVGKLGNSYSHRTFVLDNGQYYMIYGPDVGGIFAVSGLVQGSGQANNGTFTSPDLKDFYSVRALVRSGSLNATYTPGVSFNASLNEGSIGMTLTSTANSGWFNYDSPAILADITGSWGLRSLWGSGPALNIMADGSFTGAAAGCSISGTIAPRASGKNVFDVRINYGASPCIPANRSGSGIAFTYVAGNQKRQLTFAGVDDPRNFGFLMYGER
jgi:hypothetical protein